MGAGDASVGLRIHLAIGGELADHHLITGPVAVSPQRRGVFLSLFEFKFDLGTGARFAVEFFRLAGH